MSKKLIALCACPMGLAHTFMAAQALEEAAVEAGYEVKIETQGRGRVSRNRPDGAGYRRSDHHHPLRGSYPGR